tara:strand:- start:11706 stop:12326 length:621 start_codon:yes stop_codon:yes gene_type:complete
MKPSIIIADDHPLVLKGLQDFLTEKEYNIIDSATNGKEAYKLILKHEPDIAILDIRMPHLSGIEIAQLCQDKLNTKIVLITFEKNSIFYHQAKQLNIYGYLLKELALAEIENCLKAVIKGIPYFSKEIEEQFSNEVEIDINVLTPSEKRILQLIAQNKTAKEIAGLLEVSKRTIEKHKSHIIKKLKLESKHNGLLLFVKENESLFL